MHIKYSTEKDLPCDQLYNLFLSVGWADEESTTEKMIDNFNIPFINSTVVISAWDSDKLVGCVRVLSDKIFRSHIYDLAVLPEYQNQGIGTELVKRCIAHFPNSEWNLETIPDRIGFYKQLGFEINEEPILKIKCKLF